MVVTTNMTAHCNTSANLPVEQRAIRSRCFHPSGTFVAFGAEEIERSIPERFEQMVRKYPERIAVKTPDQVLTYAELNATANRVARAILQHQGEIPGAVGLFFEKGAPLIASMLGVLKAGKFFVLLDLSFPKARTTDVLEDSDANLLLTEIEALSEEDAQRLLAKKNNG